MITNKLKRIAKLIYEATRLEAEWSNRSIVPEPFDNRDTAFQQQFYNIIDKYLHMDKLVSPEEAHNSWWEEYKNMGWTYGPTRDPIKKTHPDMVPFNELPKDERDKDAIFLMSVWLVKELLKEETNGWWR